MIFGKAFGGLDSPKNKVAILKASGVNLAAMVVVQGLLVASGSYSSLKTVFLKELENPQV